MSQYKITNNSPSSKAFKVYGGVMVVKPKEQIEATLSAELTDAQIATYEQDGVIIKKASSKDAQATKERKSETLRLPEKKEN